MRVSSILCWLFGHDEQAVEFKVDAALFKCRVCDRLTVKTRLT